MAQPDQAAVQNKSITARLILTRLQQRVSIVNAKILLDSAKISTGVMVDNDSVLNDEQAKALYMRLINQGGPAFQVGQAIYKEYLM